ncbi:MAG: (d)CMP kinase [Deltaproteobacteria bacterium]|nr:(d)CMP kinase [Deltaproteobacteria bacterium]
MVGSSTDSSFPGPRGTLQAAQVLLTRAGIRAGRVTIKGEHGNFLLQSVLLSTGRQRVTLRVAHPQKVAWLKREAFALRYLAGSGLAPQLLAESLGTEVLPQPHHLLREPAGKRPTAPLQGDEAGQVGGVLARLHAEGDVSLRLRAPTLGPVSLMAAFQALSDDVKAYLARRERDGLPQDLLTMSLSDLMRALRRYVVAQEHHFLPPPPRVLCHGAFDLPRVMRTVDDRWMLTGFEQSHAGDGAADLAQLAERAELTEAATRAVLEGYLAQRAGRDATLVPRVCAWRVLFRLQRAVGGLRELQDLTDVLDEGLSGQGEALEWFADVARENMRLAMNGLRDFTGPARPLSLSEVGAMGALIAVEELRLRGTCPLVGVEGPPYTGKTPLAQDLAQRLRVPWVGIAAVLRSAAWATGRPDAVDGPMLADMVRRLQVHLVDGKLRLLWDGHDALQAARDTSGFAGPAADVLEHPAVRAALREFVLRAGVRGAVVEAKSLEGLMPPSARVFQLWASPALRAARRQAHLETTPPPPSVPPPPDPDEAPPPPRPDRVVVDGSHLSLPQMVRAILRSLVPHASGTDPTLTGRPVLFS